jgi:eukaryotic-like serine/threonine-protein kinase
MEDTPDGPVPPADRTTDWARWEEIDALFESLLDLEPGAWEVALDRVSPDPTVRRSVLRLLRATRDPRAMDPAPPPRAAAEALAALAEEQLPASIGPFRPIRELGSGGMGTVCLAERADGDFRQRVAVKVLRKGLDTDLLLARFRAERRILAGLRHPNVAHLVDGGSMPDGRPWLAMEYVEGTPLDAFCAAGGLGERDRVRLLREVAAAVREVHRNLVVHRDIKPSNVLVTAQGVPKLLDFGIAKLVASETDEAAQDDRTQPGQRMLTPRYAAPEQEAGLPVTAATDVYQLGLLLQEILSGQGDEDIHAPGVRGDLGRVVAMATHTDPLRRYRDAGALVEELDRWLDGRPVVARPDTLAYRTTRFLQRHRWVGPAAAVVVVLVVGWGWSLVHGAEQLREERDRARGAAERAQLEQSHAESATAVLVDVFRSADPSRGDRGDTLSARTLLSRGAERIREDPDVNPVVGARLLATLAEVAFSLGMLPETHGWFDDGIAMASRAYGASSAEVAGLLHARATFLNGQREFQLAAKTAGKALEIRRALPGVPLDTLASNLVGLAVALAEIGETDGAAEAAREAVALFERGDSRGSGSHIGALGQLAYVARRAGNDAEAEVQYRRLLELQPGETTGFRLARASSLNNLAQLLKGQERLVEAEPLMRESLELLRVELDPADRTLSVAFNNLSALLLQLGQAEASLSVAQEHRQLMRSTFPPDHWRVGTSHSMVATVLERQGRWADAAAERAEALDVLSAALGPDHSWTVRARVAYAGALYESGETVMAARAVDQALASIPRIADIDDPAELTRDARELRESFLARQRAERGGIPGG